MERYLASAPPHRRIGCPRKRQHPDQSEPQRLNRQLHLDRATQLHDCVVCSDRSTKRCRTIYFCKTCIDTPALMRSPMFRTISHSYQLQTIAVIHLLDTCKLFTTPFITLLLVYQAVLLIFVCTDF